MAIATRQFDFFRDTFAFRNELYWEYLLDERTGKTTTRKNEPPPTYAHRCFVVVRSVRQFLFHARFHENAPACSDEEFARRIRAVVRRSDWRAEEGERIEFPGFSCLRKFSEAKSDLLKANCGGMWQSYMTRRHWRMLWPFTRAGQVKEAGRLVREIQQGQWPILHVLRFPELSINHVLMAFGARETGEGIEYATYDPNLPEGASTLIFRRSERTFHLPRNIYWRGGPLNVYETYRKPFTPVWA